jgi:hypothetical protein
MRDIFRDEGGDHCLIDDSLYDCQMEDLGCTGGSSADSNGFQRLTMAGTKVLFDTNGAGAGGAWSNTCYKCILKSNPSIVV